MHFKLFWEYFEKMWMSRHFILAWFPDICAPAQKMKIPGSILKLIIAFDFSRHDVSNEYKHFLLSDRSKCYAQKIVFLKIFKFFDQLFWPVCLYKALYLLDASLWEKSNVIINVWIAPGIFHFWVGAQMSVYRLKRDKYRIGNLLYFEI